MSKRSEPTDLICEPPYPDHKTVLFSVRFPDMTGHLATARCPIEEPHLISECAEFEADRPAQSGSAARPATHFNSAKQQRATTLRPETGVKE